MVSFRGEKSLDHAPVSFRGLIQNFRPASLPLSYAESRSRAFSLTRSLANEYVQVIVDIAMVTVHLHVFDETYS